jgi:hypothetical protein
MRWRKVTSWRLNAAVNLNYFFEDAWAFGWATHTVRIIPRVLQPHGQLHARVTYQFAGWLDGRPCSPRCA